MKKPHATLAVLASALLCVGCGPDNTWQRHTECLITGTIPDSLSVQEVLLLPSTDRLESGIRIPVHDGRFEYLLQTDTLQLYELNVPCDHGSFYFIQFLPEAKGVRFEYSEAFEGEPIRMIAQGSDEINIIVGVENKDFEKTISVIYEGFVGKENKSETV